MKKILVTGGAGFIGSNFVWYLDELNFFDIYIVDALTYAGNLSNIENLHTKPIFYHERIEDVNSMRNIFRTVRPDFVVNFAAETHVDNSINEPAPFAETNFVGTQVLLDLSKEFNVERFIQISTDEVYGDLGKHGTPSLPSSPLCPNNPYSASKASADLLCHSFVHTYNMDIVITRCTNNFGMGQHEEKFIPKMIKSALKNRPLYVYGDGSNIRNWIYVKDHCKGILKAIQFGEKGHIYNFCNVEGLRSNYEMASLIISKCNSSSDIVFTEDRKGHDFRYDVNPAKSIRDLNWDCEYDINDALDYTINYYLS